MTNKKVDIIKKDIDQLFKKHGVSNYYAMFGGSSDLLICSHTQKESTVEAVSSAITSLIIGMDRTKILAEVVAERVRQDKKWGIQNHEPVIWCAILGEEKGEVDKAALEAKLFGGDIAKYREELIQTAAVCISMIECLDRNSKTTNNGKTNRKTTGSL